jgi:hypothetical protein
VSGYAKPGLSGFAVRGKWLSFRGPVPGNEVLRAIAAERQTVASGNVRSRVSWGKAVRCGSASGPERRRAQRGRYLGTIPNRHVLWHVGVWGLGPELGPEGHHSSPGRETEGESAFVLCV